MHIKKTCIFAVMKEENKEISNCLCRIAGLAELDTRFGEPFIKAFGKFKPQGNEEVLVASYTCSLFLSVIFNKIPTEKLHIFVHFTKEHYHRFSFNCNMYEEIFSHICDKEPTTVLLIDKDGGYTTRQCSKLDIFEAFDFYTNT